MISGPYTTNQLYFIYWDESSLTPGSHSLSWTKIMKIADANADLVWIMQGQPRVLQWSKLQAAWQVQQARNALRELGRSEAMVKEPIVFTWEQTISTEQYLKDFRSQADC